jgi:hypothetical protein
MSTAHPHCCRHLDGLSLVAGIVAVAAFHYTRDAPKFGGTSNTTAAEVAALRRQLASLDSRVSRLQERLESLTQLQGAARATEMRTDRVVEDAPSGPAESAP